MAWFRFRRGTVPLDDSALVNAKELGGLLPMDAMGHWQFRFANPPAMFQQPQVYIHPATFTAGLGGLQAGQIIYQQLLPNPNPNQ